MTDWKRRLTAEDRERLRSTSMPKWTSPMLATLTDEPFSSDDWVYERKLDGERCLAFRRRSRVQLYSRNRKRLNDTYPELVALLEKQAPEHFIADGEIVAFAGRTTSFSRLQERMRISDPEQAGRSRVKVYYYLFDLLYLDDYDLTALPLRTRKSVLRSALSFAGALRYTAHRNARGETYYREACRKGWEGLIAKAADRPYRHSRSRAWLKFKCVNQQEFVIGGYTEPQGARSGFGALLLGYYEEGELRYAGKVGTGFDEATLDELRKRLESRQRQHPAFASVPEAAAGNAHWVKPELVAEIGFTEWTGDARLRHPRFLGLRDDKAPGDVHRERSRDR